MLRHTTNSPEPASLPSELFLTILSHLDGETLARASGASSTWHRVCRDLSLWRRLCLQAGWLCDPEAPCWEFSRPHPAPDALSSSAHAWSHPSAPDWYNLYKRRTQLRRRWREGQSMSFRLPDRDHAEEGHNAEVYAVQMYGCCLISGSADKSIRIWDLQTRRLIGGPLLGHTGGVLSLQFDPRRDIIFSGDRAGTLLLWCFSTRAIVEKLDDAHNGAIVAMKLDGDCLVTASLDRTVKIWQVSRTPRAAHQAAQIQYRRTLTGHAAGVNAVDVMGDLLVSASGDRTVRSWSVSSGQCLRIVSEPRALACVKLCADIIISGGRDGAVRLYDRRLEPSGTALHDHHDLVRAVHARSSRTSIDVIASGSYDGSVMVRTKTAENGWLLIV